MLVSLMMEPNANCQVMLHTADHFAVFCVPSMTRVCRVSFCATESSFVI